MPSSPLPRIIRLNSAPENYEQQFAVSLIEAQSGVLEKIEIALERIEEGTYGICEECGCQIPRASL